MPDPGVRDVSGSFVVQSERDESWDGMAELLSAQLSYGGEVVNHVLVDPAMLLGFTSTDPLGKGVMPRFISSDGVWVVHQGGLFPDTLGSRWRADNPDADTDAAAFARMYRRGDLLARLPQLNGAFFVILWDPANRTLVAFNDRYGLYPMYWACRDGRFCLASSVLCSVLAGVSPGDWDPQGAAMLLTIDDYMGERTLVDGVESFPQASVLIRTDDRMTWKRYWQYHFSAAHSGEDASGVARELGRRLVRAVVRQCPLGRRVGIALSGGLDSRGLVAATAEARVRATSFTWGTPGCLDRRYAARIAAAHGVEHVDCGYQVEQLAARFDIAGRSSEGLINYFDGHMLAHLDVMGSNADLVLNGYGACVLLGGAFLRREWLRPMPSQVLARSLFDARNTLLKEHELGQAIPLASERIPAHGYPSAYFRSLMAPLDSLAPGDRVDRLMLENHTRRVTTMGSVLTRTRVECLAPYLDYEFQELTASVPPHLRINRRLQLAMLRMAFPVAAGVAWERTRLPAGAPPWMAFASKAAQKAVRVSCDALGRPGMMSARPVATPGEWIRGPLRSWMESVCTSSDPLMDDILDPVFCARTWAEHLAGEDRARLLGAIAAIKSFGHALRRARSGLPAAASTRREIPVRLSTQGASSTAPVP